MWFETLRHQSPLNDAKVDIFVIGPRRVLPVQLPMLKLVYTSLYGAKLFQYRIKCLGFKHDVFDIVDEINLN